MSEILDFTSSLPPPGYDLLTHLAIIVDTIAMNLQKNHLDRKSIQTLLRKYAIRAESDGQLLYVARVNECVDHALSLAESHLELVSWLVNNNYTISSTAVKWYSFERLFPRNQLPLFCLPFKTSQLRHKLKTIEERADITYADLQANNIHVPSTKIRYRRASGSRPPQSTPKNDPPPSLESFEDILRQGIALRQKLSWPLTQKLDETRL